MGASAILLGVVGRPHGVRGHVHVHSYTATPSDLAGYGGLADGRGRRFALRWVAEGVAELSEVTAAGARRIGDRAEAERLTNTQLFVDRADLPAPPEDEFYLADLIGLAAVTRDGARLGEVTALHDYGAGASLEIGGGAAPVLVPFTRLCVPEVDVERRRVVVVVPEDVLAGDVVAGDVVAGVGA